MILYAKEFVALAFFAALLVSGCTQGTQKTQGASSPASSQAPQNARQTLAQSQGTALTTYEPFTMAKYDAARAARKIIFLEFHANWCPFCALQKPVNEAAFKDPAMPKEVVGFQVSYKDSDTDSEQAALAQQFGIITQTTRVLVGKNGELLAKAAGNMSKEELISFIKSNSGA